MRLIIKLLAIVLLIAVIDSNQAATLGVGKRIIQQKTKQLINPSHLNRPTLDIYFLIDVAHDINQARFLVDLKQKLTNLIPAFNSCQPSNSTKVRVALSLTGNNKPALLIQAINCATHDLFQRVFWPKLDSLDILNNNSTTNNIHGGLEMVEKSITNEKLIKSETKRLSSIVIVFLRSDLLPEKLDVFHEAVNRLTRRDDSRLVFYDMRENLINPIPDVNGRVKVFKWENFDGLRKLVDCEYNRLSVDFTIKCD